MDRRRFVAYCQWAFLSWAVALPLAIADGQGGATSPHPGALTGADARRAVQLQEVVDSLQSEGEFARAAVEAGELLKLRSDRQGQRHWETLDAARQKRLMEKLAAAGPSQYAAWRELSQSLTRGLSLQARGAFAEAQPVFDKYLDQCARLLGEESGEAASALNYVGLNLGFQGKFVEAEPLLRRGLALMLGELGDDHPNVAKGYAGLAANLQGQARYREARELCEKAVQILRRVLGEEHPDALTATNNLASLMQDQGQYAEAQPLLAKTLASRLRQLGETADTAASYNNLARNWNLQGRPLEAQPLYEKALEIRRRVHGEMHPETAQSYNNLASTLARQAKYAEAQPLYEKGLQIRRATLGDNHPSTASSQYNIGNNLNSLGRYDDAQVHYEESLKIYLQVFGEDHPETAMSLNGEALNLGCLARYDEAQQCLERALAIRVKMLGEDHPDTATTYSSLAENFRNQGRFAEAVSVAETALLIHRRVMGEDHALTATLYNNLGTALEAQGKHAEAQVCLEKALEINRRVYGDDFDLTAIAHHNLAQNLYRQDKYAQAAEQEELGLKIQRRLFGDDHPQTAEFRNGLGVTLDALGKYPEAAEQLAEALRIHELWLPPEHPSFAMSYYNTAKNRARRGQYRDAQTLLEKALAINLKRLGVNHARTAVCYQDLAAILCAQAKDAEAWDVFQRAADSLRGARGQVAFGGMDRSAWTAENSHLGGGAACGARLGRFTEAWQALENDLGRGLWDDISLRSLGPLSDEERTSLAALERELAKFDEALGDKSPERERALRQLSDLRRALAAKYGPIVGEVYDLDAIQSRLSPQAALVAWLDVAAVPFAVDTDGDHWAVVVRQLGPPTWIPLQGSGPDDAWTEDDESLPARLRAALMHPNNDDWRSLAQQLRGQLLVPLTEALSASSKGLPATTDLVVLPSTKLNGIPLDVLKDAEDRWTASYAPSGTLYAWLNSRPAREARGLLAVGDPVFREPPAAGDEPPLPPRGLLLTLVVPDSNAARAGLQAGDVLLSYHGKELVTFGDMRIESAGDGVIPVEVWRAGVASTRFVAPGRLGVVIDQRAAPLAIQEGRQFQQTLLATRGGQMWPPLPATAWETASLARRFRNAGRPVQTLLGLAASEPALHELAMTDQLQDVGYLHLATHARIEAEHPSQSAVILSQVGLPDPLEQIKRHQPPFDGQVSVEEILSQWKLHADLVTLSACETALGRQDEGEGFVGFTQALITSGADTLCLSLWKVDDTATALLMDRFYANLLGQREGLKAPLSKVAALAEAQAWLRDVTAKEAAGLAAQLAQGVARGVGQKGAIVDAPQWPSADPQTRPFAHPYFWSSFVLVGKRE